jgi:hypothetical protein
MKTRIAGSLSLLAGVVAVALGAWGFSMTEAMTEAPSSQPFDAEHWSFHWRASSLLIVVLGFALLAAGTALFKYKRSGFVLLAFVAALAALLPWVLRLVGFSRYVFEQPSALESTIFISIGIASFPAYRHSGTTHAKT